MVKLNNRLPAHILTPRVHAAPKKKQANNENNGLHSAAASNLEPTLAQQVFYLSATRTPAFTGAMREMKKGASAPLIDSGLSADVWPTAEKCKQRNAGGGRREAAVAAAFAARSLMQAGI